MKLRYLLALVFIAGVAIGAAVAGELLAHEYPECIG